MDGQFFLPAVAVGAFAERSSVRWAAWNGFQGLVWTVAVAYTNAFTLLLAFTLRAKLESTLSSLHHLPARREGMRHSTTRARRKKKRAADRLLGIMQFKDWFCFSVCPSTVIAEGGHSEEAKVDAVRRCPYPPER